MTVLARSFCTITLLLAAIPGAFANEQSGSQPDCYDAIVKARISKQVPSVTPECGPDCLIMVWPWFLDLEVKRSLVGDVPRGKLQTLAMLHTFFRLDLGNRQWWLRRNTLGGYNVLRFSREQKLLRCGKGSEPADAYIIPSPSRSLADLRAEGERAYHISE